MKAASSRLDQPSKLQYIDCIRGIAILMVILNHADWYIPSMHDYVQALSNYGQMGVQLFFLASAYTLCLSMFRQKGDETLKTFYVRRFFRIAPLYYLGIPLYLCYHSFLEPWMEGRTMELADWYTIPNILANVFFVNGFIPGDANNRVVPGGWSIGTEMTFYLLFPFIFLVYKRFHKISNALLLIPLIGLAISFLTIYLLEYLAVDVVGYQNFYYFKEDGKFLYFNLICQLPVFLIGMSMFFASLNFRKSTLTDRYFLLAAFIGFSFIGVVLHVFHDTMISILPFIPAISFFFLFLLFKEVPQLGNQLLARIGQLSYSIYLFHFIFAFEGSRFLYEHLNGYLLPEVILLLNFLFTTLATMGIAVLSEKYIEKPGIEMGRKIIAGIKQRRAQALSVKEKLATENHN